MTPTRWPAYSETEARADERAHVCQELAHWLRCECHPDYPPNRHDPDCWVWVIDEVREPRPDLWTEVKK